MARHTQGDWRLNPQNKSKDGTMEVCSGQFLIAETCPDHVGVHEARANAQLIAYAPAMVRELEEVVEGLRLLEGEEIPFPAAMKLNGSRIQLVIDHAMGRK